MLPTYTSTVFHNINCNLVDCNCRVKIQQVLSIKYLGENINSHMRWNLHCEQLCNKVRQVYFYGKELISVLNTKSIYYVLVESILV